MVIFIVNEIKYPIKMIKLFKIRSNYKIIRKIILVLRKNIKTERIDKKHLSK